MTSSAGQYRPSKPACSSVPNVASDLALGLKSPHGIASSSRTTAFCEAPERLLSCLWSKAWARMSGMAANRLKGRFSNQLFRFCRN